MAEFLRFVHILLIINFMFFDGSKTKSKSKVLYLQEYGKVDDSNCGSYEHIVSNNVRAHWYGETEGDGTAKSAIWENELVDLKSYQILMLSQCQFQRQLTIFSIQKNNRALRSREHLAN